MKSYVLVMFVFLAVAFFHLSGGADYAPRAGSLQAQAAALKAAHATAASRATETKVAAALAPPVPSRAKTGTTPRQTGLAAPASLAPIMTRTAVAISPAIPPLVRAELSSADVAPSDLAPAAVSSVAMAQARLETYSLARVTPAPLTNGVIGAGLAADPAPDAATDIRNVLKSHVNMRVGPGTQYEVISKLDEGTPVQLLETSGDGWAKLRVLDTGRIGWIAETLISAAN